jgi:hypothetical protein
MEKGFVTYPLALRLKALGFDEPCFGCFDKKGKFNRCSSDYWDNSSLEILNNYFGKNSHYCLAPTWQTSFSFFRKGYDIDSWVQRCPNSDKYVWGLSKPKTFDIPKECDWVNLTYETYEEAQQGCLDKLCEIIEKRLEDGEKR